MVKDAEVHAEEDRQERASAEARNEADNLIYSTEKALGDYGDKVSAEDKEQIEAGISALKKALESSSNVADIKAKTESLKQASYKLAEEVYKTSSAQANAGASQGQGRPGGGAKEENVEDVDYEVVDDEQK